MITADIDMTGFNAGIAALMRSVGATSKEIVAKETGELIKTLVNITPPSGPEKKKKTEDNIAYDIRKTFHIFSKDNNFEYDSAQTSPSGVKWYAASSKYLFGALPQNDMTKAGKKELLTAHYSSRDIQGSRRIVASFKGRKTSQRVAIITKLLTTKDQIDRLVKRVQKNVGRMKAGWLVAVRDNKIKIGGRNLPKKWVTRHAEKARGRWENGLGHETFPTFTIINFAKHIRTGNYRYFVNKALEIRAQAMLENAKYFTSGKKNLADYQRMGNVFAI
jgi:hypothetical protein